MPKYWDDSRSVLLERCEFKWYVLCVDYKHSTHVDQPRTFEFYHVPRLDALMKLDIDQVNITQHYSTRRDRLYLREFQTKAHSVKVHGPKHLIVSARFEFKRNVLYACSAY